MSGVRPPMELGARGGVLDLLIVGGGVSGLTLGREVVARRPEWNVRVVEAEEQPGGTMRSERIAGCLCEWGPNGFLTNVAHTWDLAEELGLQDRLLVANKKAERRFLWVRGALKEVSANPVAFLRSDLLSLKGRLRLLLEPFQGRRTDGVDESVHRFASRRIGAEAADVLVDAMVKGIFAGNSRKLSLEACFPRMVEMERRHGSLVKAMIALRRERKRGGRAGGPAGPGGSLTSFDEGMEVLVGALAGALGSRLRTSTRVRSVDKGNDGFRVETLAEGAPETLLARRLVLATPAHVSAALLSRTLPEAAAALEAIPYAGITVACLVYERRQIAHPLDGFGFLVPEGQNARMLGCIWTGSIFPLHVPGDRVLMRAMVGGARDPQGVGLPEGAMVDLVHGELDRILGGIAGRPVEVKLYRHARGIPQYAVGHPGRLSSLERLLKVAPGLHVVGNAYRGIGVNDCVREARSLAETIAATQQRAEARYAVTGTES